MWNRCGVMTHIHTKDSGPPAGKSVHVRVQWLYNNHH